MLIMSSYNKYRNKNQPYQQQMIKKDKKSTGVARSKFIDRIKSESEFDLSRKENMNLNDIRQSSYKLPRSKSNTRYDHSLQRKSPIKISQNFMQTQGTLKNTSQIILKEYASDAPTINNTIKLSTPGYQTGSNYSQQKGHQSDYSYQQCIEELHHSRSGIKQLSREELRDEEDALNHIKQIWENAIKLKEKNHFLEEMSQIQVILKEIIIGMAKPKFNSLQQSFSPSLKDAEVKFSPFQNLNSLKASKNCSYESSVNLCQMRSAKNNSRSVSNGDHQSEAQDEIQFKKIMYILEEKSKITKNIPLSASSSTRNLKGERELREISDILNVKPTSYQSSFNCSSRELTGQTIREFEKVSNSRSNERVFLKNIVKKAKNSGSSFEEVEKLSNDKKTKSDLSSYSQEYEQQNSVISQQEYEQQSLSKHDSASDQQEGNQQCYEQQKPYEPCFADSRADHIKIETLETLQDESQSKRAVLNQIISMLNKKYHKNIKLQPRKF